MIILKKLRTLILAIRRLQLGNEHYDDTKPFSKEDSNSGVSAGTGAGIGAGALLQIHQKM